MKGETLLAVLLYSCVLNTVYCEYYSYDGRGNNVDHPEWG